MCSVAWIKREDGFEIRFNRDEQWTRPPSADPRRETAHPVNGLCARDPAGGGTWLFANEYGSVLAVMNAYPASPRAGIASRGELPLLASTHRTAEEIAAAAERHDWTVYAPCHLVLWGDDGVCRFNWDGGNLTHEHLAGRGFLSTSSFRPVEVVAARTARYQSLAGSDLASILDDEVATAPAEAICMSRGDAGTVSQSHVLVSAKEVLLAVRRRGGEFLTVSCPRRR